MTLLVRVLENKRYLDAEMGAEVGGVQADALKNFKTSSNTLSVFNIEAISLDRVLAAYAGGRDHVEHVDFAIFSSDILAENSINTSNNVGKTPDSEVNKAHIDLVKLNANQVLKLATAIQERAELRRKKKDEIGRLIAHAIQEGHIPADRINQTMISSVSGYATENKSQG